MKDANKTSGASPTSENASPRQSVRPEAKARRQRLYLSPNGAVVFIEQNADTANANSGVQ